MNRLFQASASLNGIKLEKFRERGRVVRRLVKYSFVSYMHINYIDSQKHFKIHYYHRDASHLMPRRPLG